MSNIFQNSVSGLVAFQRALATTSHNISNVNTEGFSRQRVELGTRTAEPFGNGFIGTGVEGKTVKRIFDQARQTAVERNTAELRRLDTMAEYAGRIDNLVADSSAGLSPALQSFFDGMQQVASDPTSATARQALLTDGQNLAQRLNFLDGRFAAIDGEIDTQTRATVAEINEIASSIASLNQAIVSERARTGGQPPNDLLDQRDRLVTQLSEKVGTRVVVQDDGAFNVFVGNGQSLVAGYNANKLAVVPDVDDPARSAIALQSGGGQPVRITSTLQGGELGGLLDFRREILNPTRDDLGRIGASIALAVNDQQNLGLQFDLGVDGQLGDDFFNLASPRVVPRPENTGGGNVDVQFAADAQAELNGANYRLRFDGADWNLTRLSDGQNVYSGAGPQFTVDGLDVDVSGAAPAAGDSFLIQPTRELAASLDVALSRPAQVAAASPLSGAEATDRNLPAALLPPGTGTPTGQSLNAGSGSLSDVRISTTDGLPTSGATDPIVLTFDAGAGQYNVTDATGNDFGVIAFDPATNAGGLSVGGPDANNYTPGGDGSLTDIGAVEFTLAGAPENGDRFVIARNSGARGDNGNALALGKLADTAILDGGDSTFQEAYAGLVGDIGTATLRSQVNRDAQQSVLEQAEAAREAVSGVNLDEEAANLLRYQQAYQASAQAVSIANTLFDSLLAAVRR